MNKNAIKKIILIVLGIIVALFVGLLILGSLLPDEEQKLKEVNCSEISTAIKNQYDATLMEKICKQGTNNKIKINDDNYGFEGYTNKSADDFEKYATEFAKSLWYYKAGNDSSKYNDIYRSKILEDYFNIDTDDVCISRRSLDTISEQIFGEKLSLDKDWWQSSREYFSDNYYCQPASHFYKHDGWQFIFTVVKTIEKNIEDNKASIIIQITDGNNEESILKVNFDINDGYYIYNSYEVIDKIISNIDDLRLGLSNMAGGRVDKNTADSDMKLFTETVLWYVSDIEDEYLIYQYLNSFGSCVDKNVIREASKRLYGNEQKAEDILNKSSSVSKLTNYYCFSNAARGDILSGLREFETENKTSNTWIVKYKLSNPDGSNPSYKEVNYKLIDGYWTIESMN